MSYRPKIELSNVPNIPDNVYYDVLISNFNSTTGNPIPIYFNENRTNPIIQSTGEYDMSIIRFQVDTPDIPSFIPVIKPFTTLNNLTNYVITLTIKPKYIFNSSSTLNTTTYISQANVIWVTQDTSAPIPPPPSSNGGYQSNVGDYYYCYSYQHFISLVQAALVRAFNYLKATLVTAGYTTGAINKELAGVLPPIFSWDSTTNCAVISTPQYKADNTSVAFETRYLDGTTGDRVDNVNGVKMYFNSPLFQLFTSFNADFKGQNNSITTTAINQGFYQNPAGYDSITIPNNTTLTGLNYEIIILNQGGTNQILTPTIYEVTYPATPLAVGGTTKNLFLQTFQEYSTTINWTPVESIVFVSNTLPIVSNQLASPLIFNENQIITGEGNNAKFAQIITDIVSTNQSYKPNVLYLPTAEYRMVGMSGNRPLTNVDISVFWRNRLGQLIPLNLLSGGSCSVKFLFRKKV